MATETAPLLTPDDYLAIIGASPDVREAERRVKVLSQIQERQKQEGPRRAYADDKRASQFAPFDALEGFSKMIEETIERSRREGEEMD